VAQRVGRGIALLFHDRGTRRGWVVSSTPRPHFTPRKDPVPILQEGGWAPEPVWTDGKSRPHQDWIPDRPACSQSLYRLSYPADFGKYMQSIFLLIYVPLLYSADVNYIDIKRQLTPLAKCHLLQQTRFGPLPDWLHGLRRKSCSTFL